MKYKTKYEKEYNIEVSNRVLGGRDMRVYEVLIRDLLSKAIFVLSYRISNLRVAKEEAMEQKSMEDEMLQIVILHTKIILENDNLGNKIIELKIQNSFLQEIGNLKSKLEDAQKKRIGFK